MKNNTNKYLRKIKKASVYFVTTLIIFTFVWSPFNATFTSNVAYAQQNVNGGYDVNAANNFSNSSGVGLSGYIKTLAPVISKLPQCQKVISSELGPAIKSLFKKVKGLVQKILKKKDKGSDSGDSANQLPTDTTNLQPDAIEIKGKVIEDNTANITSETKQLNKKSAQQLANELCLKSVGQLVAHVLLQKTVASMQAWIQNGFEGKPFFVQDYRGFFHDIYQNEVLQLGAEITDLKYHPYGKDFMKSTVNALNTKFQDNARYSLNEFIQQTTPEYTDVDFKGDFSMGGWNAWNYLTTTPANNPIGFQIMASNELARRVSGANKSPAVLAQEALTQAGGFLGQDICVDPEGLTHAQSDANLVKGKKEMRTKLVKDPVSGFNIAVQEPTGYVMGTCKRWKYQTAGEQIMHKANVVIDYPENGIIEAKDLNSALVLLLDSVLAHFSSKLQEGFADASNEGSSGAFIISSYNDDGNYGVISQTEKDFTPAQLSSRWLEENPDFNIRTDVSQALIDEQRTYAEKLTAQNIEIPQLIMDIRQLDYCIPGTNPDVETISSVDKYYDNIDLRTNLKAYNILGTVLDIGLPILGGGIAKKIGFDPTSILSGIATTILENEKERTVKANVARFVGDVFGVHIYGAGGKKGWRHNDFGDNNEQDQVLDEGDIRSVIDNTWNSYMDNNYRIYFNGSKSVAALAGAMPFVTNEARNEFSKIKGYEKMAENNYDAIQSKKGLVFRLTTVKDAVDKLNASVPTGMDLDVYWDTPEYMDGTDVDGDGVILISPTSPDIRGLRSILIEFARISSDMVSGDDIALVDNTLKEIKSERDYVWDDLLKGDGGCEKELETLYYESLALPQKDNPYRKFVRRQPYPLPVYYFYGTVEDGVPTTPPTVEQFMGGAPGEGPDQLTVCGANATAGDSCWSNNTPLGTHPWSPSILRNYKEISPREGFQYGMVYFNKWTGPGGGGVGSQHSPPPDEDMDGDGLINSNIKEFNVDGDYAPAFTWKKVNGEFEWVGEYEIIDDIPTEDTNGDGILNLSPVLIDLDGDGTKEEVYDSGNGVASDDIVGVKNHYDCTDKPPFNITVVAFSDNPGLIKCDDDPDPYDINVPYEQKTIPPPIYHPPGIVVGKKPAVGRLTLCPEYIQFPEDMSDDGVDQDGDGAYVELSLPSPGGADIGGLEPKGWGDQKHNHANDNNAMNDYKNICGVVTSIFERNFGIY